MIILEVATWLLLGTLLGTSAFFSSSTPAERRHGLLLGTFSAVAGGALSRSFPDGHPGPSYSLDALISAAAVALAVLTLFFLMRSNPSDRSA